jgi:hypothetical protein
MERKDAATIAKLAAAVASPIEPEVPAIEHVRDLIAQRDAPDTEAAQRILDDHLA